MREIIRSYTRESGVRLLEREIAAACRKAASGIAEDKFKSLSLKAGQLEPISVSANYKADEKRLRDEVGLVRGSAYTSVGGEVLDVELAITGGFRTSGAHR
ncbi:MAG: S16 family serine protease [Oscillospiraceae bacterium]